MPNTEISKDSVKAHGLTPDEYQKILKLLGRTPNLTELGVFSVMWSEHCSYKSSRVHLRKFPTSGPHVVQGPGENAGVVDIGDGKVVVFKMESHNHPSFIEPYQGAATGVGGILRDVFTMGARPIALLNSLRFGSPTHAKTKHLVEGVVSGIGGYGNPFGCPTVGGEVFFDASYNLNPLVNAFCLGISDRDKIFLGRAEGKGNPVIYAGSKTGRDGIHGATMASQEFDDTAESKKPTVQVGDPFCEKLLLEACLELMQKDYLVGIQDMGAAGLTSSSVEMASRAGNGIELDLSQVPAREENMTPYDFLLSESQERMLLVVKKGFEKEAIQIFHKWELDACVIGVVTEDGKFRVKFHGEEVCDIPVKALTDEAPVYERPYNSPEHLDDSLKKPVGGRLGGWHELLIKFVSSPNLCSRKWVYRQYDHQVRTNTVMLPGGDAAMVRIEGTKKGIAITTDCNARLCQINPRMGAQYAIAEAARNISAVGATPLAVTDCLNFGNPEKPEIMWQFKEAVEGLAEACQVFETPVVSGNVSLYNETNSQAVFPTPTIGMVGLISNIEKRVGIGFQNLSDEIYLIGESKDTPHDLSLDGSEYLNFFYGELGTCLPKLDLAFEKKVQTVVREAIEKGLLASCHDISDGGLLVALLESAFQNDVGFEVSYEKDIPKEVLYFGESPSRYVVSVDPKKVSDLENLLKHVKVPYQKIGCTHPAKIQVNSDIQLPLKETKMMWENAFEAGFK